MIFHQVYTSALNMILNWLTAACLLLFLVITTEPHVFGYVIISAWRYISEKQRMCGQALFSARICSRFQCFGLLTFLSSKLLSCWVFLVLFCSLLTEESTSSDTKGFQSWNSTILFLLLRQEVEHWLWSWTWCPEQMCFSSTSWTPHFC